MLFKSRTKFRVFFDNLKDHLELDTNFLLSLRDFNFQNQFKIYKI